MNTICTMEALWQHLGGRVCRNRDRLEAHEMSLGQSLYYCIWENGRWYVSSQIGTGFWKVVLVGILSSYKQLSDRDR
jgi:hypothetical protein